MLSGNNSGWVVALALAIVLLLSTFSRFADSPRNTLKEQSHTAIVGCRKTEGTNSGALETVRAGNNDLVTTATTNSLDGPNPPSDTEFDEWVQGFKAADPAWQQRCKDYIGSRGRIYARNGPFSQVRQDLQLFHDYFFQMTVRKEKGFYIESGANHWSDLSNTLLFDKCLGWSGLCIEPQSAYHAGFEANRSCELIKHCISDKPMNVTIGSGAKASVNSKSGESVSCINLAQLLLKKKRQTVDLWILDIEGSEMPVIRTFPWQTLDVRHFMVEDMWIPSRTVNAILTANGYSLDLQMGLDSVFRKRSRLAWRPEWQASKYNVQFGYSKDPKYQGGQRGELVVEGTTPIRYPPPS